MAKQKGRLALLQIDTSSNNTAAYTSLAGMRTKSLTINNERIDTTTAPGAATTPVWKKSLSGMKTVSISGDGIAVDDTAEAKLHEIALSLDAVRKFKFVVPDFGSFEGEFAVTEFTWSGDYDGALTFSISLESTTAVTYTTA